MGFSIYREDRRHARAAFSALWPNALSRARATGGAEVSDADYPFRAA
jgi:hypothetical protein